MHAVPLSRRELLAGFFTAAAISGVALSIATPARAEELKVGILDLQWPTSELQKQHEEAVLKTLRMKPGAVYNQKDLQEDYRVLKAVSGIKSVDPTVSVVKMDNENKVKIEWRLSDRIKQRGKL